MLGNAEKSGLNVDRDANVWPCLNISVLSYKRALKTINSKSPVSLSVFHRAATSPPAG